MRRCRSRRRPFGLQSGGPANGYPLESWFNDVWFTNMQQEFQMMIVVSWTDLASRLVFALGLIQCMEMIKEMLEPSETSRRRDLAHTMAVIPATAGPALDMTQEGRGPPKLARPIEAAISSSLFSRFIPFLTETAGPVLFVPLGFAILFVHMVSELQAPSTHLPCRLTLHPWFATKPACSLVELDCHHLGGLSGSQDSLHAAWNTFAFETTARVVVRDCPQLEIPPTIQAFHHITAIKLYNCTIATWSKEAALTGTAHPNMRAVYAVRTQFPNGELPVGVLTAQFPKGLHVFSTRATNLGSLPDDLDGMTLAFEQSALQIVPSVVVRMSAVVLSFAGSPITTVPPTMFESPLLMCVMLSYTQIQELPRVVHDPSPALLVLALDGTNVSTFWSWMDPFVDKSMSIYSSLIEAYGSRFCSERDEIVAHHRTSFDITASEPGATDLAAIMDVSTPAKLAFATSAVQCEPGPAFYFPIDLEDAAAS